MACQSCFCNTTARSQEWFSDCVVKKRETLDPICHTVALVSILIFASSIVACHYNLTSPNHMKWVISSFSVPFIISLHVIFSIKRHDKTLNELRIQSITRSKSKDASLNILEIPLS